MVVRAVYMVVRDDKEVSKANLLTCKKQIITFNKNKTDKEILAQAHTYIQYIHVRTHRCTYPHKV